MKNKITKKEINEIAIHNREIQFRHHSSNENLEPFELVKQGNRDSVTVLQKNDALHNTGLLSHNPLRNTRYLFVSTAAYATNYAIQGGLDSETAYNISDSFIQLMDEMSDINDIQSLKYEMIEYFTKTVAAVKKEKIYSIVVIQCIEYIDFHLHEKITLDSLAKHLDRNPCYISTLFKKEIGKTLSAYILEQKINVAKQLLNNINYSYSDISNILAFSSQSYFIYMFKKETGLTPKEYRTMCKN